MNQFLTRKLGVKSKASALSFYIQGTFIVVSLGFYLVARDGRFAQRTSNPSMKSLLRARVWPSAGDWWVILGLASNAAAVGYCLSHAYRSTDAATVAL